MIRRLSSKDKINFLDFYLQKDKDLQTINREFRNIVKRSGTCFVYEKDNDFLGILTIDKNKYVEIFADTYKIVDGLLRVLVWNQVCDVFWEVSKDFKFKGLLRKYKFYVINEKEDKIITSRKFFKRNIKNGRNYNDFHHRKNQR